MADKEEPPPAGTLQTSSQLLAPDPAENLKAKSAATSQAVSTRAREQIELRRVESETKEEILKVCNPLTVDEGRSSHPGLIPEAAQGLSYSYSISESLDFDTRGKMLFDSGNGMINSIKNVSRLPRVMAILGIKSDVKINAFSGTMSEDFVSFRQSFMDHLGASTEVLTEQQKVSCLLTFLAGTARNIAGDFIKINPDIKLDELWKMLAEKLLNPVVLGFKETQLKQCKQEEGESVDDFYTRLLKLASAASTEESVENVKRITLDTFLNGLNLQLQETVRLNLPETTEKAFEFARTVELIKADMLRKSFKDPRALAIGVENRQQQSESGEFQGTCFYCKNVGHPVQFCTKKAFDKKRKSLESKSHGPISSHRVDKPRNMVLASQEQKSLSDEIKEQFEKFSRRLDRLEVGYSSSTSRSRVNAVAAESCSVIVPVSTSLGELFTTVKIPIQANGIHAVALVDTGAGITLTSKNILQRLGITKFSPSNIDGAVGFGGNKIPLAGSAIINLQVGSRRILQKVYCNDNDYTEEDFQFVFGNDLLSRLPMFSFDYQKEVFHLGKDMIPFYRSEGKVPRP